MKEHLFLLETNLQPVNTEIISKTRMYKHGFEELLATTVYYSYCNISEDSIRSNEFVTPFTLDAEEVNVRLTGAKINTEITKSEMGLVAGENYVGDQMLETYVYDINLRSFHLLKEVIAFQKSLLDMSAKCKIFISLYDEMLEHDTREAEYYYEVLKCLLNRTLPNKTLCDELNFWNNIMGEHAQFIDGMLDPTERHLKNDAEMTAKKFEKLVADCIRAGEKQILKQSIENTDNIQTFKEDATIGLLDCEIKSIIPPLLADHVLREANHYRRLLEILNSYTCTC
jgi:DUF2935 family protein